MINEEHMDTIEMTAEQMMIRFEQRDAAEVILDRAIEQHNDARSVLGDTTDLIANYERQLRLRRQMGSARDGHL